MSVTEAKSVVKDLIPADSQYIRTYIDTLEDTVDLYSSAALSLRYSDSDFWGDDNPGSFSVSYIKLLSTDENIFLLSISTIVPEEKTLTNVATSPVSTPSIASEKILTCPNPGVQITSPIAGTPFTERYITIVGTANIPNFQLYKIEFSTDPTATVWNYLLENNTPINNGQLMELDTSTIPSGPYGVRLTVVDNTGNYPEPCIVWLNDSPLLPINPATSTETTNGSSTPFQCIGGCAVAPDPSCTIKGNVNSKGERIYHTFGSKFYSRTDIKPEEGDRWFCTAQEARDAGFRPTRS